MTCPHGEAAAVCCIECLETTGFGSPTGERITWSTTARHHSTCPACGDDILAGMPLHVTDEQRWICDYCASALPGGDR